MVNKKLEFKTSAIKKAGVQGVMHSRSNNLCCCGTRKLVFSCRLHLKNLKPASVELTVVLRRTFQLMYDGYFVDAFAAAAL